METKKKESKVKGKLTFKEKILKLQESISYIQKQGENKFDNYKYVREADVKDKFRKEMVSLELILESKFSDLTLERYVNANGKIKFSASVKWSYRIIDVDNSAMCLEGVSYGTGTDAGDKAVFKAQTGAIKSGLMGNFLVPSGDEPEVDGHDDSAGKDDKPDKIPTPSEFPPHIKAKMHQLKFSPKEAADFAKQCGYDWKVAEDSLDKNIEASVVPK